MTLHRRTILAAPALLLPVAALAAPQVGAAAPQFALPDQDGVTRRLSDYLGKVVVLQWENHECPYVRKHYNAGNMQALQREAATRGIVWLSIASSPQGEQGYVTGADAKALSASRSASPTAVLLDHQSTAARAYAATVTPQMIVIDQQGNLRYNGAIDSIRSSRVDDVAKADPWAKNAMIAVVEGRSVERPLTQGYGCAIKYVGV